MLNYVRNESSFLKIMNLSNIINPFHAELHVSSLKKKKAQAHYEMYRGKSRMELPRVTSALGPSLSILG